MDGERCVYCGALIALVGRVHLCKLRPLSPAAKSTKILAEVIKPPEVSPPIPAADPPVEKASPAKTDRKAYMKEYMRKRRAEAKK